ncbi:MAG TPA: YsnF/AvaK domain-containing protein [Streptosporangiaceae bacterium]|nr:YsnF/AvaK domain-containing protein [Streptosporangiaceae bacterium]
MTMHADQLVGAPVIDSDGRGVGTVEQVFRDDVDGTPSWARIRSAKGLHFVPLAGGKVTHEGGLSVAFDEQKILSEPDINVDRHMSVDQEEELRRYFGLSVPAQAGGPEAGGPGAGGMAAGRPAGGPGQTQPGQVQPGQVQPGQPGGPGRRGSPDLPEADLAGRTQADQPTAARPTTTQPTAGAGQPTATPPTPAPPPAGQPTARPTTPGTAETRADHPTPAAADQPAQQWMVRSEERFSVNLETQEASRVRLRKYVETEPVEQTVKVFHEVYEVERVPIAKDDKVSEDLAEGEQEIILREARAIVTKESVPVERVRLAARKVEEDKTIRDELRRERIEILGDDDQANRSASKSPADQPTAGSSPAGQPASSRPASGQPPSGQPRR